MFSLLNCTILLSDPGSSDRGKRAELKNTTYAFSSSNPPRFEPLSTQRGPHVFRLRHGCGTAFRLGRVATSITHPLPNPCTHHARVTRQRAPHPVLAYSVRGVWSNGTVCPTDGLPCLSGLHIHAPPSLDRQNTLPAFAPCHPKAPITLVPTHDKPHDTGYRNDTSNSPHRPPPHYGTVVQYQLRLHGNSTGP